MAKQTNTDYCQRRTCNCTHSPYAQMTSVYSIDPMENV